MGRASANAHDRVAPFLLPGLRLRLNQPPRDLNRQRLRRHAGGMIVQRLRRPAPRPALQRATAARQPAVRPPSLQVF